MSIVPKVLVLRLEISLEYEPNMGFVNNYNERIKMKAFILKSNKNITNILVLRSGFKVLLRTLIGIVLICF